MIDPLTSVPPRRPRSAAGHALGIVAAILLTAGCAHVPFDKPLDTPLGDTTAAAIRQQAVADTPRKFSVLNTIVFEKFGRAVMALGYTDVDMDADTVSVLALSPAGVKLFEFQERGGVIHHQYVIEHLARLGDVVTAVAADIRRVYFDRVPPFESDVVKKKHTCEFTTSVKTDVTRYVFGGEERALLRKTARRNGRKRWAVSYYEYQRRGTRLFPGGIVLKNDEHGYRLTVRLKDIFDDDESVSTSNK
ncbi:MAG: DUF3261 domain-containing protein [Lentisphaeria bacterium]|nr:DUF3261 domain-containing protein [Lentisphaeria bacterium]